MSKVESKRITELESQLHSAQYQLDNATYRLKDTEARLKYAKESYDQNFNMQQKEIAKLKSQVATLEQATRVARSLIGPLAIALGSADDGSFNVSLRKATNY